MSPPTVESAGRALPGFGRRLRMRLADPANLSVPLVVAIFCVLRSWGLIADVPYWAIAALVGVALVVNSLSVALWSWATSGWQLTVRVGVEMAVITVVIYGIGWGSILVVGYVFGAADVMRSAGSAAARPAIFWTLLCISLGQLAIIMGLAPTLIHAPLVYGLGALEALGAVFTIEVLEWFARARESSEGRFKALVQDASDIIVVADPSGRLSYVSPAFERTLGAGASRFANLPAAEMMHPDDLVNMRAHSDEIADPSRGLRTEIRLRDPDGGWRWFDAMVTNHLDDPNVRGIVANLHEITERKLAEDALREAHERFRSAFENAPIGMAMSDLDGGIMRVNSAYARIVGLGEAELGGMNIHDLTHPEDRAGSQAEARRLVSSGTDSCQLEVRCSHADGHDVWVSVSLSCVRDDAGSPLYLISQIEDVTERLALRERLAHAAIHDPLTGLPNRVLFMDRLELALRRARRGGHLVAVMFLDLDRFKLVNDSLGHDAGDRVLCLAANELSSVLRASDTLARFGGDEFTVLCEVADRSEAVEIAGRLVSSMNRPLQVPGIEHYVSVSLGLAMSGGAPSLSGAELLRNADVAMFQAKETGPGHIEVYQPDNETHNIHLLRTSNELHRALERREFELHYQPLVELHSGSLVGLEALVRWRHPTRGLLQPAEFVPLAEAGGLIVPLGRWVLGEACRQVAAWRDRRAAAGADESRLNISVNVSARQLADASFPEIVARVLDESHLDPDRLWLEITESTLMGNGDSTLDLLRSLRELGVHLEIDDFGTGYSSLSYLKQFPVETLKIDRSFVDELDQNSGDVAIVRAIIALGDSLGLSVVAEGVERPAQADELRALGCFLAQGYLYGTPQPARAIDPYPTDDLSAWSSMESTG